MILFVYGECIITMLSEWSVKLFTLRRRKSGVLMFKYQISFHADLFRDGNGLAYKYYVINSHHKDCYEYLHGLPTPSYGGHRNRWLKGMSAIFKECYYSGMLGLAFSHTMCTNFRMGIVCSLCNASHLVCCSWKD